MEQNLRYFVQEFLLYLSSVRELSENSVKAYGSDLDRLVEFLGEDAPIENVSTEDLRFCIAKMSNESKSAATVNRFIAATRTFFAYCRKFLYISKNPALELKTVKIPKYMPAFLTGSEIDKLCRLPEQHELLWETRDKALFEMMYSSGCRVSEIISLKKNDFSGGYGSAVITGKGRKDRRVYFEKDAQEALKKYLADRKKRFSNEKIADNTPYIFVNQKAGPLTAGGVRYILSKYSGKDGLNHHISPHSIRHTFATAMLANGADVRVVQEFLGHSSISTTQRYTHITTEKLIDVYNNAHPHSKD